MFQCSHLVRLKPKNCKVSHLHAPRCPPRCRRCVRWQCLPMLLLWDPTGSLLRGSAPHRAFEIHTPNCTILAELSNVHHCLQLDQSCLSSWLHSHPVRPLWAPSECRPPLQRLRCVFLNLALRCSLSFSVVDSRWSTSGANFKTVQQFDFLS